MVKATVPIDHRRIYAIKDLTAQPPSAGWTESIQVNGGKSVSFKVDTGSDVNIISSDLFKSLRSKTKLHAPAATLTSYSGHPIHVLGSCDLKCLKNGKQLNVSFCVVAEPSSTNVLGLRTCLDLGIVHHGCPETQSIERLIKFYRDVFDGVLPNVLKTIKPYHIDLVDEAKPIQAAGRKPAASFEAELQRLVREGVLVHVDELVTKWSNPLVVVTLPTDTVRLFMDCRPLNKYIVKNRAPLPGFEDYLPVVKGSQYFSTLAAPQGYLQVPLDEYSSNICAVLTPYGRYKFRTVPYGLWSAPEIFHSLSLQIFAGLEGAVVYGDDLLVHAKTAEEHATRLARVLERARKFNVQFSKSKCRLGQTEAQFAGYVLSAKNGWTVDPSRSEAVRALGTPSSKQQLCRFIGMVDFLVPTLTPHRQVLQKLLGKGQKFEWKKCHEAAFQSLKQMLGEVRACNPTKTLYVSVAASSFSIGAVALQDRQPLAYFSTNLTVAQQKYNQIEKKLLAIWHGLRAFRCYTYGKEVVVQSDHRPLLATLKEPLDLVSGRVQRLLLKLMAFHFKVEYAVGADLAVAYALSREPPKEIDELRELPANSLFGASAEKVLEFKRSVNEDAVLQRVIDLTKEGWPKYPSSLKGDLRHYFRMKEHLSFAGDLLFCEDRLVVPQEERLQVLRQLHAAHQSVRSCQQKAANLYYWPSMNEDIERYVANCAICQRYTPEEVPWNTLSVAFLPAPNNKFFLLVLDQFSKFLTVKCVNVKTVKTTIDAMEEIFATHGLPLEVVAEHAPPFNTSDWRQFLKTHDVKLRFCLGEDKCMSVVRALVRKSAVRNQAVFLVVLDYNSTPREGDQPSPAELLMGRRLRSSSLVSKALFVPQFEISKDICRVASVTVKSH